MANRTDHEIGTATAIATAIVKDSFCRIISIDAFFLSGCLLCSSVAQIGEPARSGDGAKRRGKGGHAKSLDDD